MAGQHAVRHILQGWPAPVGLLVLVEQPGAHALGKLAEATAVLTQRVFHAQAVGQAHAACVVQLLPAQRQAQRAGAGQAGGGFAEQGVITCALCQQGRYAARQVGVVEQGINLRTPSKPLACRAVRQGLSL